jgi:large subunit ribosomal protein L4
LLSQKLKDMGLGEVMLITDKVDENLYLSSRNLPHVMVVEVGRADPVSLLRFENVLMTQSAVTKIEEILA